MSQQTPESLLTALVCGAIGAFFFAGLLIN